MSSKDLEFKLAAEKIMSDRFLNEIVAGVEALGRSRQALANRLGIPQSYEPAERPRVINGAPVQVARETNNYTTQMASGRRVSLNEEERNNGGRITGSNAAADRPAG